MQAIRFRISVTLLVALLVVLLSLTAVHVAAQTTASISGAVTDETGGVVVGAKVTATNTLTNETRRTQTNEAGYYHFPELPVGDYRVQVEMQGFKVAVREGIQLSLNRNAQVSFQLAVGAVSEKVSVAADAPLVEAASNTMGGLVDRQRVVELPLNGRNTLSLVSLIPGAQQLQTGNAQGFIENKVNVNGIRQEDSNWLLDGGDNTSPLRNYGNDVPNPDAIQEFRLLTNNYDAEYGRTVGAVVNVITKSGTNEFHGSAFYFLRNRRLNARNLFEPDTTPLVQNQYGGTFGGPIRRDKTFFFGTYQGFRRRTADFRNVALVPTAAERAGDLSRSVDRRGVPIVVRDPVTGRPFPGNVIPPERLSPVAVNFLKLAIPLPNYPANGPNGLAQRASEPRDNDQFLVKLDHLLSDRHKLSGAYFWSDSSDGDHFLSDIDFAARSILSRQHNLNLHEYWTISPTKLNHFHATFSRSAGNRKVTPDDVSLADLGARFLPLPEGPQMPPNFDVRGYFNAGSAFGGPKIANHYVLSDTFSWTRGRHQFKFGAEGWLRRLFDVSTTPAMGGEFVLDGTYSGNALSDLMLGLVRQFNYGNQTYKSNNAWALHWFVQDNLRVSPKLVLNLGLRYELTTWPVDPLDTLIAYRPERQSTCVPQAPRGVVFPCDDGIPRAGAENDYNNFAPRLGIAYDLFGSGKTVVRMGYGVSYAFAIYNQLQGQQVSTPFALRETIRDTTLADPYRPIGSSPFPFRRDPASLKFPVPANYGFQDFHMRNGYIQQYNFSLQRQLGKDWSVEAAYVGNMARKLAGFTDINSPLRTPNATASNIDQRRPLFPTFRQMNQSSGFVNSSYNAFQARAEKRFSRGFTFLGSYTVGKALDEASWYDSLTFWADQRNRALDKAASDFDRRQMLVLSWVWELPFFASAKGASRTLLGGWSVNGIASFYSGQPLPVRSDSDRDFDGNNRGDRPDVVGDWRLSPSRSRSEVIRAWFRPDAFLANRPGQLGNLGRNVVYGPGSKNFDLGIFKSFRIGEGRQVQFRCEMFNAFNFVNLGSPEVRLSRATFGQIQSAQAPRIFQFGLKYLF